MARSKDPNDARSTLAHLSDEGWNVLVQAAPHHVEAVRRLVFDPLTPTQVRQMRSIHQRIKAAIAPDSPVLGYVEDRSGAG